MNAPYREGKQAAREWIGRYELDDEADQPRNPYPRRSDNARLWDVGYSEECYRHFGDPDADMQRLERQFGA
jgi:hypothetical protein